MTETAERVGLVYFSVRMAQRGASETAEPLADLETSRTSYPEYPAVPSWDCQQLGAGPRLQTEGLAADVDYALNCGEYPPLSA